jgi:tetratricopeptide (TPR) repeat protein
MEARKASLLRTAYLLTGDRHSAEDLVQVSLAKLYLAWDRVQDRGSIDGYVRRIMVNENNSLWRRGWKKREYATESMPETWANDEYDEGTRGAVWAAAGAAGVVSAAVLGSGWLAARDVAVALSGWRTDLPAAYANLRQAASLNRLTDEPYVVAGTLAERHGDWPLAERQFRLALRRDDRNWYSHLELAVALSNQRRFPEAERELLRAHELDPLESLITDAIAEVRAGRHIDARSLDREIIARTPAGAAR